ncbi:GntR family transcriptional regulator [Micromonospora yangpuensis]|uniref:GntR family transcriptional regulator n=1 Tax=Micromonospora yangpuensis TaxID=683228 RepID=UPI000AF13768|nr:winged helix-turn-helix domain-containing protein [Micromonospora yangpuensis]
MTIDPHSRTPVYAQLADLLRQKILSGELPAGSILASETRMSQEYGIGRDAVRRAVLLLRSEGLVNTSRGLGTRVREAPQRRQVELAAGESVITRMPTDVSAARCSSTRACRSWRSEAGMARSTCCRATKWN